jgi:hypothetical protein
MTGKLIAQEFSMSNRANLWQLREYRGTLDHTYCDPLGQLQSVTAEHADRLITAGKNVYVDVPFDDGDPNAPKVETIQPIDAPSNDYEDEMEQARRLV